MQPLYLPDGVFDPGGDPLAGTLGIGVDVPASSAQASRPSHFVFKPLQLLAEPARPLDVVAGFRIPQFCLQLSVLAAVLIQGLAIGDRAAIDRPNDVKSLLDQLVPTRALC